MIKHVKKILCARCGGVTPLILIPDARGWWVVKGKGHPCKGTEALYRPYGP
jgi:hypothetical protein